MITPELISRYPFFSGLDLDHLQSLADAAEGITLDSGRYIFHKGDALRYFYIVVEGAVGIVLEAAGKPDTIISAVGPGHVFAWSALVAPYQATASAKTLTPCWLTGFDGQKLRSAFQQDCRFAYRMMERIVQISRDRLIDARIESLVFQM